MTLEEQYKKETGQDAICITTDGIHCVGFEVYRFDYVKWLEEKASRDSRQLSAVPSEEKLSLNDLDGKTLSVKFTVKKGKLKVYPEEFDLE